MTLHFRRRHHDGEATHDRARALWTREMLEPLETEDASWLGRHLEACSECRREHVAHQADRALLRSLRETTPQPPRDLWARTAAALDREAASRPARGQGATRPAAASAPAAARSRWSPLPFGAAAGALLVLVLVGSSIVFPPASPSGPPFGSAVALAPSNGLAATPIIVEAKGVNYVRSLPDGSWEYVTTDVDAVCPKARLTCLPTAVDGPVRRVELGAAPSGLVISPLGEQLVVVAPADATRGGRIIVVQVPKSTPTGTPMPTSVVEPSAGGTSSPASVPPTDAATPEPPSTATPEVSPGSSPSLPADAVEIATGVTVVGDAAYSDDGQWLAFSARPSDGSTGPDLYLWSPGQPAAVPVTTDHQTYFSSWLDGRILASRVGLPPAPAESPAVEPDATPAGTSEPTAATGPSGSAVPEAPGEVHPVSFLLDPATLASEDLAQPDVWMPVVDRDGRFAVYWNGTLRQAADGHEWELANGHLVLDGWSQPLGDPLATPGPIDLPTEAAGGNASKEPGASPTPPAIGPAGTPTTVVPGAIAAFKAMFDPSGTRLAVWVGETIEAPVGRLHLIVLDPRTRAVSTSVEQPLPGAPSLRRFSIDVGRVAWVSPSGQDGKQSAVQVLAWSRDDFGEIQTLPAKDLYIVR